MMMPAVLQKYRHSYSSSVSSIIIGRQIKQYYCYNNNFICHNTFCTKRNFFSKRKRRNQPATATAGRRKESLRSRIERRLLEKELGVAQSSSSGGGGIGGSSYATTQHLYPLKPRSEVMRYIDPWYDLATLCSKKSQEDLLIDKVDSATRIYGVVAALMCSLSAALLAVDFPSQIGISNNNNNDNHNYNDNEVEDEEWNVSPYYQSQNQNNHIHHQNKQYSQLNNDNTPLQENGLSTTISQQQQPQPQPQLPESTKSTSTSSSPSPSPSPLQSSKAPLQRKQTFLEHVLRDYENQKPAGTSLLVRWGMPSQQLHDYYAGCCAMSFYTASAATGLAGVLNAWLAATPPGGIAAFTKSNSKFIALIPALLGTSKISAGLALFVGLDKSKGTPVSYVGLGGIIISTSIVLLAATRGWNSTYRLIRILATKIEKKNINRQQALVAATAAAASKNVTPTATVTASIK